MCAAGAPDDRAVNQAGTLLRASHAVRENPAVERLFTSKEHSIKQDCQWLKFAM